MTSLITLASILYAAGAVVWVLCGAIVLRELLRVNRERRP